MGGVILLIGVSLSSLLFVRLDTPYTWAAILAFLAFGALGAADDWKKLTVPKSKGMSEKKKLLGQLLISVAVLGTLHAFGSADDGTAVAARRRDEGVAVPRAVGQAPRGDRGRGPTSRSRATTCSTPRGRTRSRSATRASRRDGTLVAPSVGTVIELPPPSTDAHDHHRADLQLPFTKRFCLDLGLFLIPFGILVIVGTSNAVNLTDGLDGLAIGCTATVAVTLTVVAYLVGRVDFARDLYLFHVAEGGELAIIGAALAGGSLGFLWFNGYPASVFMGDTGALAIGGILGVLAVALRHEVTLLLTGGIFVVEAVSVIGQRFWFKRTKRAAIRAGVPNPTGRRWLRCAPLHHHFQQTPPPAGPMHENKVTVRFWIVSVVCALVALATLKVR